MPLTQCWGARSPSSTSRWCCSGGNIRWLSCAATASRRPSRRGSRARRRRQTPSSPAAQHPPRPRSGASPVLPHFARCWSLQTASRSAAPRRSQAATRGCSPPSRSAPSRWAPPSC
eukprot:scaffold20882_cov71-Phaeocystis_antarctica.AAC.14